VDNSGICGGFVGLAGNIERLRALTLSEADGPWPRQWRATIRADYRWASQCCPNRTRGIGLRLMVMTIALSLVCSDD
jgi:hypothetical protein